MYNGGYGGRGRQAVGRSVREHQRPTSLQTSCPSTQSTQLVLTQAQAAEYNDLSTLPSPEKTGKIFGGFFEGKIGQLLSLTTRGHIYE